MLRLQEWLKAPDQEGVFQNVSLTTRPREQNRAIQPLVSQTSCNTPAARIPTCPPPHPFLHQSTRLRIRSSSSPPASSLSSVLTDMEQRAHAAH